MADTATRLIDLKERPWCRRREFQRLLGLYKRDEQSGLYFSLDTDKARVVLMSRTFLQAPQAMQDLCLKQEVTFSSWGEFTADCDSSTFYADCSGSMGKLISPHIEMGGKSLTSELVLPHMTHELAHLWWRCLPQSSQNAYRLFLLATCPPTTIEVTPYVEGAFESWQSSLTVPDSESYVETMRQKKERRWVEESFCETVAVVHVREHLSYNHNSTVDVGARQKAILTIAGLAVG